ncbi:hypothetical protein [Fictibacillus barbaricus]|uniref:Uncharacterized protein n=1 Tax=Fictibacillus barbaricus TaxID=182136 RepID=A0ABS2Z936_9BACL|nr:hypothetical protein [Fictibacillus barbaricus]MBN3544107.1 hypothetical protein [Fictibacillus barbaricus]GGB68988.1 hypothetical protein GCM10007199_38970 [Fictibacillus barbaricus]
MDLWWFAYALIVIISIIGLVGTIWISTIQDKKYGSSTKQNLIRLTLIYAVLIIVSLITLAIYMFV